MLQKYKSIDKILTLEFIYKRMHIYIVYIAVFSTIVSCGNKGIFKVKEREAFKKFCTQNNMDDVIRSINQKNIPMARIYDDIMHKDSNKIDWCPQKFYNKVKSYIVKNKISNSDILIQKIQNKLEEDETNIKIKTSKKVSEESKDLKDFKQFLDVLSSNNIDEGCIINFGTCFFKEGHDMDSLADELFETDFENSELQQSLFNTENQNKLYNNDSNAQDLKRQLSTIKKGLTKIINPKDDEKLDSSNKDDVKLDSSNKDDEKLDSSNKLELHDLISSLNIKEEEKKILEKLKNVFDNISKYPDEILKYFVENKLFTYDVIVSNFKKLYKYNEERIKNKKNKNLLRPKLKSDPHNNKDLTIDEYDIIFHRMILYALNLNKTSEYQTLETIIYKNNIKFFNRGDETLLKLLIEAAYRDHILLKINDLKEFKRWNLRKMQDLTGIDNLVSKNERFLIIKKNFYIYSPIAQQNVLSRHSISPIDWENRNADFTQNFYKYRTALEYILRTKLLQTTITTGKTNVKLKR